MYRRMLERAHVGLRARRRWIVRVVAVAVLLAGAVLVGRDWLATNRATERAEDRLREVRHDLGVTSDDHAAAVVEVEALRDTLAADLATLTTRQGEQEAAQGAADATSAALAELQGLLAASTADLATSTDRLSTLQECLVGVAEALNQAAAGDTNGLGATMREIEGTCSAAGAEL